MAEKYGDTRRHFSRVARRTGRWKRESTVNAGATRQVTAVTVLLILNCFYLLSAAASSPADGEK